MTKKTTLDLVDMLTMSLGEISSVSENLADALFLDYPNDNKYKSAYAIKYLIDDLEKRVLETYNLIK